MKEREKKRAKKPDQAAAKGKPSGGGDNILGTVRWWQILCVKRRQPFSFGFGERRRIMRDFGG